MENLVVFIFTMYTSICI